ncbi:MAG: hypothetical protein ACO4CZ_19275, partial [Planctomycetota bacterium]
MRRLALTAALFAHTALPAQRPASDLWSLQPLAETAPPALEKSLADWARQPLDQFVAARLAAAGLEPSPEADRRTR